MHVLKAIGRPTLLVIALVSLAVTTTLPTRAHPPDEPDHGVNESSFWTLWAGDEDGNLTANTSSAIDALANASDVPLDRPPRAVEMWNTGEMDDLPETDSQHASHPQNVTRTDGAYLRDVGVSILAVQPSTRVHLDEDEAPLYIAPNGTVLGYADYRVAVPETRRSDTRTTRWSIQSHDVESIELHLDGEVVNETTQTQTPTLSYSDLTPNDDTDQQLTVEATVTVSLRETTITQRTICSGTNGTESCRTEQSSTSTQHEETITVSDSVAVRVYVLTVSGFQATYPDGDMGLVTYKSSPWYGLSLPEGEVRGVWRFYVAREVSWDRLRTNGPETSTLDHSPAHPLQVHAYPIETGPTPWPRSEIAILDVYGTTYDSPDLPADINLDSIEGSYTGSFGIATRIETTDDVGSITAVGLVRGSNRTLNPDQFAGVSLTQSNLTLTVTNRSSDALSVEARLEDAETGEPIATASRNGYLRIAGQRYETNETGQVTLTLSRDRDAVSARYIPGDWWRNIPGYTGDSAVVSTGGTAIYYLRALFGIAVPVGTLLLAGYLISRLTTWRFWPPWRGL